MLGAMKFDDSSLTGYLVKNLEPLTEADPAILAEYVVALLKKDKPLKDLEKLCADNLVEFLGHSTTSFIQKLFIALEDGSIVRLDENLDVKSNSEPSQPPNKVDTLQPKSSSLKEENHSTSSEPATDPEDRVSDDDDDRNHKHRRREALTNSSDNNIQEHAITRPNRKRSKPYDSGQPFGETNPQHNETQKEYYPTSERDNNAKFEKRRFGSTSMMRPVDSGPMLRVGQPFRTDPGARFDLPGIGRPPVSRGRGRGTVTWSQHNSRFNPLDTLDFATQMASQGPAHPNLFIGAPSAGNTQNASWGAFGLIPGMSSGILDPLHPLNLQGTLQPTISPPLNLGMPRQRCRDFEERGFCLRGDMCPMEHGVNRIVVEDVQSLSQFNLPVSVPSSHTLGIHASTGSLMQVTAPLSLLGNNKVIPSKSSKLAVMDDTLRLNGTSSAPGGGEADVYDPDQPLWNNECTESSSGLSRLQSPNIGEKPFMGPDSSARHSFRLSDEIKNEQPRGTFAANISSHSTMPSVWGRIGSGAKSKIGSRTNDNLPLGNGAKEDYEDTPVGARASNQGKSSVTEETGSRLATIKPIPRARGDSGRIGGKQFQKATRTLFVNGIPQNSNKSEALLSHFQKFGQVIDIYIPMNSEKAFVQFSKSEEAEAAFKAPDAVMGNRFIKLRWANRDSISDEGKGSGPTISSQPPRLVGSAVSSQLVLADRVKENHPSAVQKGSIEHIAEIPSPSAGLPKKITNIPKASPPVQKKIENLELLEELRKKQESLAQKRDEFRRQLAKYEKQAISTKKGEAVSDQAVKRHKLNVGNDVANTTILNSAAYSTAQPCQETEKIVEKSDSGDILVSQSSKAHLTTSQHSPKNIKHTSRLPQPLVHRFKLDNRSTSFRILPPLPANFTDVSALKDHFSSFGDLSSVVVEEVGAHTDNTGSGPCEHFSACITFTTRNSAEKAYMNGKIWQGHSLQFMWLTVSSSTQNDSGIQGNRPSTVPIEAPNAKIQAEPVTSGSSSSTAGRLTHSVISEIADSRNGDSKDLEGTNHAPIGVPEAFVQTVESSPTTSGDKCISKSDVAMIDDKGDIDCA